MLSLGKHITQKDDPLEGIEAGQLFEAVRQPETVTLEQIRRLRAVRKIDKKQYGLMKRELPYIVGGVFDPPYRRMENFGYIEYFILDIDHVSEKEMDLPSLRAQLQADSRVMLCFLSPGEDGLKLLFRLSERCFDAGRYSLFYKTFIRAFSQQYHFEQVIDSRTSDASRACFLSYDPDAYFNTEAEAIVAGDFVDFDNPFAIGELRHQIQKEMDGQKAAPTPSEPPAQATGPDEAAISFIKARLQAKSRQPKPKPQVYVPEELDDILEKLLQYIGESGVQVNTVENIQYGKKFRFHAGAAQAEVNLFFGHRGFTVVQSPRQGTSPRLNELMASYIRTFIDDYTLVNENLPLTQAPLPDKAGQIRQQANALNAVKNYAEALPLYRDLWNGHREACNEWDGWHYAFCLKQTKDYKAALDVCRQAWRLNPAFEPVKSLYAWCIYYTEITSEKVKDEARYFKAAKAVVQLCKQEDTYSAYTVTLFKVLNYLNGKASFPTEQLLTWTALLQPALLDDKAFRFTDRNGKERELASKREQYYMIRSRALLEAGRWDECLQLCEEALEAVKPLHYDNEVWFRWRIGLCYEGKGLYGEALKQQLALLSR
ncbi:MAG: hypothetical protein LBL81_00810 [Tannerella sp.]|jgi:tetratricopeptide (TPR) repeat protein|nr:hypothetical protein [Tannerella sp.]